MERIIKNQSGSVILYALLVMALITAIGIGISVVMIRELKLTQNIHYASLAYYASESGIEKGLYKIRVARDNKELSDTLSTIKNYKPGTDPNANNFGNGATYDDYKTENTTQEFSYNLEQDQTIQVDLYDPDTGLPLNDPVPLSVAFSWENEATWIEVSYIKWEESIPVSLDKLSVDRRLFSGSESGTASSLLLLDGVSAYRIRVRAYFSDAKNLKITAWDVPNPYQEGVDKHVVDIKTRIVVNSVGKKDDFNQSLTATVPWKVPIFGLYDYAVFSEGEVKKTEIVGSAIYSSGPIQVEDELGTTPCSTCSACEANGWLVLDNPPCVDTIQCNQLPNEVSWCSMENTGGVGNEATFTLPIPGYIPSNDKLYLSLGLQFTTLDEELQVDLANNPSSANISNPSGITSFSCTVTSPETFDLRTSLGDRNITFTNKGEPGVGDWWSSGSNWGYRKPITISNSGGLLTNFQVNNLTVGYESNMQSDFDDLRFTNLTGTELKYWIQTINPSVSAIVWIKVDSINASGSTTIYMYYGNASVTTTANFDYTFTKDYGEPGPIITPPVALWHMDPATPGQTIQDSSGNNNTGTLGSTGGSDTNDPAWLNTDGGYWDSRNDVSFTVPPVHSLEFGFGGTNNDYVSVPDNPNNSLEPTSQATWEAWIRPDILQTGTSCYTVLAKREKYNVQNSYGIGFCFAGNCAGNPPITPPDPYLYVEGATNNGTTLKTTKFPIAGNFVTGVWQHMVVTYDKADATQNFHLYVNGTNRTPVAGFANINGDLWNSINTVPLKIGGINNTTACFFDGQIDEVRIYNRVLTQPEIQAHYERRKYSGNTIVLTPQNQQIPGGRILIDWYQLTGFKVFPDCP